MCWAKSPRQDPKPVPMTPRFHLFPFRTQKLSLVVPKILGWRRPGKIGRCRHFSYVKARRRRSGCAAERKARQRGSDPRTWPLGQAAKTSPSHGENGSSILPGVTRTAAAEKRTATPHTRGGASAGAAPAAGPRAGATTKAPGTYRTQGFTHIADPK